MKLCSCAFQFCCLKKLINRQKKKEMISSPTPSGLLSVSCGIKQKYILQVYRKQEIQKNKLRIFLSDGSTIMCAQTQTSPQLKRIQDRSLLRVELQYYGYQKPLIITQCEILEQNCPHIFGVPVPFVDFLNKRRMNANQQITLASPSSVKTKKQTYAKEHKENKQTLTQKKVLQVQDIERQIEKEELIRLQLIQKKNQNLRVSCQQPTLQQPIQNLYTTIVQLYPKMKNWKLLARVTWMQQKICTSHKGTKFGRKIFVINFRIADKSGEVKCTLFEQAAHKFKYVLKKNNVYEFSGGTLIEDSNKSQNSFYPEDGNKLITIRFETYSKIIQKNGVIQSLSIPLNFYKLSSFSLLYTYSTEDELDIAGFIKAILKREQTTSQKKKLTFILANPLQLKQIQASVYIDPEEANHLEPNQIAILKNIKVGIRQDNLLFLRSCYNTHIITQFASEESIARQIRQSIAEVNPNDYQSLSEVRFYRRSLKQLEDSLNLIVGRQSVYSKIHCYFAGLTDERKFTYQACYKCNKKISIVDKYSNFCPKCSKIVEIKQQFLLRAVFADHTGHLKIAVLGDSAKFLLGTCPEDFSKLTYANQLATVKATRFRQFVLSVKTCKIDDNNNHTISTIEAPTIESNLQVLHRYLEDQVKFEEAQ